MVKRTQHGNQTGFTLMELMIVMVILGVLAAMAVPAFKAQVKRTKEAALREDLLVMRQAIDQYTVDKQKAPQSLDDLVQAGYLHSIPVDPFTNRNDTWMTESSGDYSSVDQTDTGTISVHSGAQDTGSNDTPVSSW